ncbi:TPA: hypothetical protein ACFOVY_002009, partial [Neisseria meningitidis]
RFFLRFRATSKPSFPRRRESRPLGDGNIQRLSESLEVLDSRFHGNDGMLWESRPLGGGNIQRLSESLEVLDSRFHGNDGMLRESGLFGFGFF